VTLLDLTKQMAAALAKYQEAHPDSDVTKAESEKGWALATAPDGTDYLVCEEGVGYPLHDTDNTFDVWFSSEHSFQMLPAMTLTLTADEVKALATGEVVDLADHVRVFGGRLEDNFWLWHSTLAQH
jgi:hypothetical protein